MPYGLAVNRARGEFYVTDAKNYVIPGRRHCYDLKTGKHKWDVRTGDIPAHFAFTNKPLQPLTPPKP